MQSHLSSQYVTDVRRIRSRRDGTLQDTNTYIFTFSTPQHPRAIKITDWLIIPVEDYQYRPQQCYKCLKFGHVEKYCRNENEICARCGTTGHRWRDCSDPESCRHCNGTHLSTSKQCPKYKAEDKILSLQMNSHIPRTEALAQTLHQYPEYEALYNTNNRSPPVQHPNSPKPSNSTTTASGHSYAAVTAQTIRRPNPSETLTTLDNQTSSTISPAPLLSSNDTPDMIARSSSSPNSTSPCNTKYDHPTSSRRHSNTSHTSPKKQPTKRVLNSSPAKVVDYSDNDEDPPTPPSKNNSSAPKKPRNEEVKSASSHHEKSSPSPMNRKSHSKHHTSKTNSSSISPSPSAQTYATIPVIGGRSHSNRKPPDTERPKSKGGTRPPHPS